MRVAITQELISSGGRIAVIIEMISILNELQIEPDIITFGMSLSHEDIKNKYGKSLLFKVIKLSPNLFRKLTEFNKLLFNLLTRKYTGRYDIFIDSNNTACLMTKKSRYCHTYIIPGLTGYFTKIL